MHDGQRARSKTVKERSVMNYSRYPDVAEVMRSRSLSAIKSDIYKAKISNAEQMKVHTMLVIGNRDLEANAVSLRVHGKGNLGAKPRNEVIADLLSSITERRS